MNLDDALQTFIIEGRELLEHMEDALLHLEHAPDDMDSINAIFRAAHTIKGSAGLFGLNFVVSFTHVAESVLDKVRSNELTIDEPLVALLLEVCDHLGRLLGHVADGSLPDEDTETVSQILIGRLNAYLVIQSSESSTSTAAVPTTSKRSVTTFAEAESSVESEGGGAVETDNWHLSLRFGPDVFRNGMDPLSFIRYLRTLGTIVRIVTITDAIPKASEMDAESCYLGFEINFKSDTDKATIESVFDFVREDSLIHILPPRSKISEYIQFIHDLPEAEMRLGEILLQCGTLTETELQRVLQNQATEGKAEQKPIGEVLVDERIVQPSVVAAALEKQKQVKETKTAEANLIRVDAVKLDQLINLVGELIIAGAGANMIAQRAAMVDMLEATSTISRLVEEVRDSALALRMVQIGATFNRFQRVVRDVSKELGKDIHLEISGEDTELDKTVVERIGDPLTHLVRNSMDHGIEPADVRLARGKPAQGTLKLNAYHDAGSIMIEVSDDGGGLNRDKILAKAIERGLVKPEQQLSDNEIYNLIFEAGFSTADAVSNLSGRGVGMDVVRRNIQALRGTVDIQSELGKGATMSIRLPLTLAIIDGFLVGVGQSTYIIPLDMVIECIELGEWSQGNVEGNYLNLRGEVLPFIRLRKHFEVEGESVKRENVVVVRYGDTKVGLVVDRLLGEFQTVIKPLGKVFSQIRGIGGFTILGTGDVALILDVSGLLRQVAQQDATEVAGALST
ncbi:chemotaxis protein CheA [Methyloradius palustris]|uniref:Chemotaxis protein CheA n=1 Tax=Methyloradius palustris TaxID=2778876 RepID=A0A8D5JMT5_9PROT|nr:chemotaxis protein CheA [Methyloradius palustris]BCM26185.1 chemotaxis protein CheA [Methyloradius palustris]